MWFRRKTLLESLNETKKIRARRISFTIRKFNVLDYLEGLRVLQAVFDTYKGKPVTGLPESEAKKIKEHFRDIFLAGVVEPKLARKKEGDGLLVDYLFDDWELCSELYEKIVEFAYGKKKLRRGLSSNRN